MNPYHYSVVRCRDSQYRGEQRNVGLLVVSPARRKAWLRRGPLEARAHLVGDDAAFVRALLDVLKDEAVEIAKKGDAAVVHDWMRARSRPTEDALSLSLPAMGIAEDLEQEVRRLRELYLGSASTGGRTAAEKVQNQVLRHHGLAHRFSPREFDSGPATWRFSCVADGNGPVVFNALQFQQKRPESIIDGAYKNVGRIEELAHYHPRAHWLTLALGPMTGQTGRAFERAREVMSAHGLNLVEPDAQSILAGLARFGIGDDAGVAQAK